MHRGDQTCERRPRRLGRRTAALILGTVVVLGGSSAMALAVDDPSPGRSGTLGPGTSMTPPVGASPSPAATLDPGPTPRPTPFRHEGRWVAWMQAADRLPPVSLEPDHAGWYLDSDRGRMPVLMWAGDLDEAGALLLEALGEDATFEVRPAERTWRELNEIADRVSGMSPEFDELGILLVETEFNTRRNRVDVGIFATKRQQPRAERLLAEFGDAVRVRRVLVPQFDS